MALQLRFMKATGSRRDQNEFNRAQRFEAKFIGRFEARFRQVVRLLDDAVTAQILRETAVSLNPDAIFTAWDKIDAYEPLVKTALTKVSDISFDQSLDILLAELMAAKGTLELSRLEEKLGKDPRSQLFDFKFDLKNPFTIPWIRNHRLELVREIDASTRLAIQTVLVEMVEEGVGVAPAARRIRASIGLTSRQATALSRTARAAITNGAKASQVARILDQGRKKAIKARAENIARTEIARAESAAQEQAWRVAVEGGVLDPAVRRRWISGKPPRTDALCLALEAHDPVGLGQPFLVGGNEFFHPPAHPQCRCTIVLDL